MKKAVLVVAMLLSFAGAKAYVTARSAIAQINRNQAVGASAIENRAQSAMFGQGALSTRGGYAPYSARSNGTYAYGDNAYSVGY